MVDSVQVYYNAAGNVLIELDGSAMELSREEAEVLFLDLGYCLKDMDYRENPEEIS